MYLTMETIHQKWELYVNSANTLLSGGNEMIGTCGGLLEIAARLRDNENLCEFLASRTFPNFWNEDKDLFTNFCQQLNKCDF